MKRAFLCWFAMGIFAGSAASAQSFRGTYTLTSGGVTLTLSLDQGSGGRVTGTLSSTKGTSFRLEGEIEDGIASGTCSGGAGQSMFEAEFEGSKLIFTLTEIGAGRAASSRSLEFTRTSQAGAKPAPPATKGQPVSKPTPPPASSAPSTQTDTGLLRYFAGEYYSYSGGSTIYGGAGTERTVTLCPDGTYRDSYEFSASGTGQWGGASSRRGTARWSMQGDKNRGVITITYPNGQTKRISLQVVSKSEGILLIDGIKFAFAGAPKCR
jgi:hypothetical protein